MNEGTNDALSRPNEPSPNRTVRLEGTQTPLAADQHHIDDLIQALGTPKHRAHRTAVDELVAIGPAAVPALTNTLGPDRPWLTAYRAAEALAQIGDGRASNALMGALRHPNSNVRWSAVQALAEIGDTRSIMALRHVARNDRGKTSWGEAVSDTAQLALDRLQSRSIFLRFWDPIKTIFFAAVMIAAAIWAFNQFNKLRDDLSTRVPAPVVLTTDEQTATAVAEASANASPSATPAPSPTPPPTPAPAQVVTGRVNSTANVRSGPSSTDTKNVIGQAAAGSDVQISGQNGDWYKMRVQPNGPDGWISKSLVQVPNGANIPNVQP